MDEVRIFKPHKLLGTQVIRISYQDAPLYFSRRWRIWHSSRTSNRYLVSGHRTTWFHREVMTPPRTAVIDHINGDGLDNRRVNLRICTQSINSINTQKYQLAAATSEFKGVNFNRKCKKWMARITHRKTVYYLGLFPTEHAAALAYDKKARTLFGECAILNGVSNNG